MKKEDFDTLVFEKEIKLRSDRVKELGDTSVPFRSDVHAFVFSDNSRKLESDLYRYFEAKRVFLCMFGRN